MKKLITLILVSIFAIRGAEAQVLPCNAGFQFTFLTPNEVKFFPANGDTVSTTHNWTFGDNTSSTLPSPIHQYQAAGTYTVVHSIVIRSNGMVTCTDSFTAVVQIQSTNPCNIDAHFAWMQDSTSNLVYFQNNSTPINLSDSVRWSFGDGTSANTYHASHNYTAAGTYQVCMRIWQRVNGVVNANCYSTICENIMVSSQSTCNLVPSFNAVLSSNTNNSFTFNNTSFGIAQGDSIRWTFGDGTSANTYNASHTYSSAGSYTVCLRVIKRDPNGALTNCAREYCRTITVQSTCNLVVNFSAQTDSLSSTAIFTNTSTGASPMDSIRWNFGDGTSANTYNATHTYTRAGSYQVCLVVMKRDSVGNLIGCARDICRIISVGTVCNLQITFTTAPVTASPNTRTFTAVIPGYSAATDSVFWSFGDSTFDNSLNPTHTFANPGTYRVCLRVKRSLGGSNPPCIRETCQTIVIAAPCSLTASYSYAADTANSFRIIFTNLSNASITQGAIVNWTFGDGTGSTAWNPVHNYQGPGYFIVCLRVQTSSSCVREYCDSILVTATGNPCYVNAEFSFLRSATDNQQFSFRPRTVNSSWSYNWNFGDNSSSQDTTPVHRFANPGTYNVCLTVIASPTCSSTICRTLVIQPPFSCDSVRVSFTYRRDSSYPNRIYLNTSSNYPVLDQTWTITKLPTNSTTVPVVIHRFNPSYYFRDTGTYQICLRAVTLGGCIKESCQTIHIDSVVAGPNACFLQVYPNPASTNINLSLSLAQPEVIHVYIYNSMNMLVRESHTPGSAGWNTVSMYVGNLMPGGYFVRVVYGNSVCYARFYKF